MDDIDKNYIQKTRNTFSQFEKQYQILPNRNMRPQVAHKKKCFQLFAIIFSLQLFLDIYGKIRYSYINDNYCYSYVSYFWEWNARSFIRFDIKFYNQNKY